MSYGQSSYGSAPYADGPVGSLSQVLYRDLTLLDNRGIQALAAPTYRALALLEALGLAGIPNGYRALTLLESRGIELLQAIDAANQRFRDWASGYLAGKGVTAAYAPKGTPEGVKLIRQAAPEAQRPAEPTPD